MNGGIGFLQNAAMARLPRLDVPGQPHLVHQPVREGDPLVRDDEDVAALKAVLAEQARLHRVAVHGWRIEGAGLWLLLTPADKGALARLMQGIGRRHVLRMNQRHGRQGGLWAGRFRSCLVQPGPPWLDALQWIESTAASESSREAHLGRRQDPLLTEHAAFWALGNTPFEREARWRQRLDAGLTDSAVAWLARSLRSGRPAGDAVFLARLRADGVDERLLSPRPRGRPPAARPEPAPPR